MKQHPAISQVLEPILREQVIPWVEKKSVSLMLAQPPWSTPPGIRVSSRNEPLLNDQGEGRTFFYRWRWPDAGVHALRIPYMVCVLEGEADIRIGVTEGMAKQQKDAVSPVTGAVVLSLPQRSVLLIPPGVPHADASRPHWERPHPEQAYSYLLWMHFLPAGVALHTCRTEGHSHTLSSSVLLSNTQLIQFVEAITEELQENGQNSAEISRTSLYILLLHIERELYKRRRLSPDEDLPLALNREAVTHSAADQTATIQRARRFIRIHLNEPLTLEDIAAHAYVSGRHLNRLFQNQLGKTAMAYVQEERIELAKSLLRDTDLPIYEVGKRVGYRHVEHFNRVFRQQVQFSPGAFRRQG